jgi:hypothetical protein
MNIDFIRSGKFNYTVLINNKAVKFLRYGKIFISITMLKKKPCCWLVGMTNLN